MADNHGKRWDRLSRFYASNPFSAVAYIDETLELDDSRASGAFYVMGAVIVANEDRDQVRGLLLDKVTDFIGEELWHTTDQLKTPRGRRATLDLLGFLANEAGRERVAITIVTYVAPSDLAGESARAQAMKDLLGKLASGELGTTPTQMFVLDRRRERRQVNLDARTHNDLKASGILGGASQMAQAQPSEEPLLYLADLACSAYRQHYTGREESYFTQIGRISVVSINGQVQAERMQPQAAVATPGASPSHPEVEQSLAIPIVPQYPSGDKGLNDDTASGPERMQPQAAAATPGASPTHTEMSQSLAMPIVPQASAPRLGLVRPDYLRRSGGPSGMGGLSR